MNIVADSPREGALVDAVLAAARAQAQAGRTAALSAAELFAVFFAEFSESPDAGSRHLHGDSLWGERRTRSSQRSVAWRDAWEATATALTLALGWSWSRVDAVIDLGLGLRAHPDLDAALREGRCDDRQAAAILTAVRPVADPASATMIVRSVTTDPADRDSSSILIRELRRGRRPLWQVPPHQLARLVAREAARLEPATATTAQRRSRDERRVDYVTGMGFGPASLVMTGPEPEVSAAYSYLDKQAHLAREEGTSLDHLRFDLAIGGLTNGLLGPAPQEVTRDGVPRREPAAGTTLIQVITPGSSEGAPGLLVTPRGLTPISPDETARHRHSHGAAWQDVTVDPATGTATGLSHRYRPARRLRELVAVRDGFTSRFPSGNAIAELDHLTPYDHDQPTRGGSTSAANLGGQATRDHQAKTRGHFRITGDAGGELTITDRTGHRYRSDPYLYLDPDSG